MLNIRHTCEKYLYNSTNEVHILQTTTLEPFRPLIQLPSLKKSRSSHCVILRKSTAYILGGICIDYYSNCSQQYVCLNSCESINLLSQQHEDLPDMNDARFGFAAALYQDSIVVMGGKSENGLVLASVERFCFTSKTWTYMTPLTAPRYGHCAFVSDNVLYVLGGHFTDTVEAYDPINDSWSIHDQTEKMHFFSAMCSLK